METFLKQFPLKWSSMFLGKCAKFIVIFTICLYLEPFRGYQLMKFSIGKTPIETCDPDFFYKMSNSLQWFPLIWQSMYLKKCATFMVNFTICIYLEPFLRYWMVKFSIGKMPTEVHDPDYFWFSFIQIAKFLKWFPFIWSSMHLDKCNIFLMDLSLYLYLGPFLR